MHSAITRAMEEGELYLTDTSANNETSKRAHPFLSQLCSAAQKRQGSFPEEVCFVSLPWGRSSKSSEINLEFQKGPDLPANPVIIYLKDTLKGLTEWCSLILLKILG